jgi:excisionase family DNA binding protein
VVNLLKANTDMVILDSAPILEVIETRAIANVVDAVALVVNNGKTRSKDVKKVADYFNSRPNNNLLGLIFNRAKIPYTYGYASPYSYRRTTTSQIPLPAEQAGVSFWGKLWQLRQRHSAESSDLTLKEAADQLGVSEPTARRWCESGKLPAKKSGRNKWTIKLEDMNTFITSHQWGSQMQLSDADSAARSAISQINGSNQANRSEERTSSGNVSK